jgi:hypothetical protein
MARWWPSVLLGGVALLSEGVALAQVDLSGEWRQLMQQDGPERDAAEIGEYAGLPINDAGRLRADTWSAGKWDQPEHTCEPHPADYAPRGPGSMRVWADMDPRTMKVSAWHTELMWMQPQRDLHMDGRAHPPVWAPHSWQGYSTAHWNADMLEVDTDHLKEGWLRRNGLPRSSRAHLKEFFIRHEDYLTLVAIVHDPVYLSEPFIISSEWIADPGYQPVPSTCIAPEEKSLPRGYVAYHLPGQNAALGDYATHNGVPVQAERGGAETMYPEYQAQLARLPGVPQPSEGHAAATLGRPEHHH